MLSSNVRFGSSFILQPSFVLCLIQLALNLTEQGHRNGSIHKITLPSCDLFNKVI
ncbi:hypothetical protein BJV82DRAFT_604099 [Fennellomyces sp. T-0311]|nr:hypothetical protein BJV82DRAFT_604099 [Fennellomyces sp. T-0311]